MTLLNRAITEAVQLIYDGVTKGVSSGFTMQDGKGATGSFPLFKGILSSIWKQLKQGIIDNLKSIGTFYLEELATQLMHSNMYAKLNSIEWADTRLWEIRIDNLPKPFTGFAPINQATLSSISVDLGTMRVGNSTWQYISGQGTRSLSVIINDDVRGTMEEYLYAWMDEISGYKATGVVPIDSAGRVIQFRKLSRSKRVVAQTNLYCVPQGSLVIDNNQSSATPRQISMTFAVLGIERKVVPSNMLGDAMGMYAAVATANLARRNKFMYNNKIVHAVNKYILNSGILNN